MPTIDAENGGRANRDQEPETLIGAGDKPFEFKGTNAFMITTDINSKDVVDQKVGV